MTLGHHRALTEEERRAARSGFAASASEAQFAALEAACEDGPPIQGRER